MLIQILRMAGQVQGCSHLFFMQYPDYSNAMAMEVSLLFSVIRHDITDPHWNITAGWVHKMPFVFLA